MTEKTEYPEELPGEDWRPLPAPHGDWLVSNRGRVWSMRGRRLLLHQVPGSGSRRTFAKTVKLPSPSPSGAPRQRQTARVVARLVLEAFVSPAPTRMHYPRYKDGDAENLAVENLEWGLPDRLTHMRKALQ